jgi:hypothetical protein
MKKAKSPYHGHRFPAVVNEAETHEVRHRQSHPALHAAPFQPIPHLTVSGAGGHHHQQMLGFTPGGGVSGASSSAWPRLNRQTHR